MVDEKQSQVMSKEKEGDSKSIETVPLVAAASSATPSGNDASPASSSAGEARTDRPSATTTNVSEKDSEEEGESAQKVVYFLN